MSTSTVKSFFLIFISIFIRGGQYSWAASFFLIVETLFCWQKAGIILIDLKQMLAGMKILRQGLSTKAKNIGSQRMMIPQYSSTQQSLVLGDHQLKFLLSIRSLLKKIKTFHFFLNAAVYVLGMNFHGKFHSIPKVFHRVPI